MKVSGHKAQLEATGLLGPPVHLTVEFSPLSSSSCESKTLSLNGRPNSQDLQPHRIGWFALSSILVLSCSGGVTFGRLTIPGRRVCHWPDCVGQHRLKSAFRTLGQMQVLHLRRITVHESGNLRRRLHDKPRLTGACWPSLPSPAHTSR